MSPWDESLIDRMIAGERLEYNSLRTLLQLGDHLREKVRYLHLDSWRVDDEGEEREGEDGGDQRTKGHQAPHLVHRVNNPYI